MSNFPNLRRLFVEARTDAEESTYSRTAFYNLVLFLSSVTVFSLVAQRVRGGKAPAWQVLSMGPVKRNNVITGFTVALQSWWSVKTTIWTNLNLVSLSHVCHSLIIASSKATQNST
ncbi:hypothetical protein O988_08885 [Pseudogymnoascus sp. VKM F-3808]|nr:hypothetical protein O988_08885 [Pseudogymnoascus sp. VKM F-3808]